MGKAVPQKIKNMAKEIFENYKKEILELDGFDKIKEFINSKTIIKEKFSKKYRNLLSGYLVRLIKKEKEKIGRS